MYIGNVKNAIINLKPNDCDMLWVKLMSICSYLGCHQRSDRSFNVGVYQFPLCARCTGIFVLTIVTYVVWWKHRIKSLIAVFFLIPMVIDGMIQYCGYEESTNLRRFVTGSLGGYGATMLRMNIYYSVYTFFRKRELSKKYYRRKKNLAKKVRII